MWLAVVQHKMAGLEQTNAQLVRETACLEDTNAQLLQRVSTAQQQLLSAVSASHWRLLSLTDILFLL